MIILSNTISAAKAIPELSEEEKLKIKSTRKYMTDMLLMLVAPVVMAWYYYGERALRLVVLSVLTAMACEFFGSKILKSSAHVSDLACFVTGVTIAMCVPASSSWWLVVVASAFAIICAKLPFGTSKSLMFLPAAAGIAFVTVCNSAEMFAYSVIPEAGEKLAIYSDNAFVAGDSIASMLTQKTSIGVNIISYIDILVGNVSGPMGATCGVAMLGALLFLIIRRPKTAVISGTYLAVCAAYAFLFPRITTGRLISVCMELSGGLLFFAAVFFITNEELAPKRFVARIYYGAFAGLFVMLLRTLGAFEDSTVFAVLFINAVSPVFDMKIPLTKKEKVILQKQLEEKAEQQKKAELEQQNAKKNAELASIAEKISENIKISQMEEDALQNPTQEETADATESNEVASLQDLSDITLTENDEDGGDGNV